ncbi:MAG: V-type ATPase subunit, partial [Sphaerochaeta sp.]|nr:V-type ATPase subunit [Sphaerochaeta sp.]
SVHQSPYEPVLAQYSEQDLEKDGLISLESKLDLLWYEHLRTALETLGRQDREVASTIFSVEVDLKNLLTLARYGWYHQMEGDALRSLVLPWGKVATSKETERYIQTAASDRDPVALINRFAGGLEQDQQLVQRGSIHIEETSVLENLKIEDYLEKKRHALYHKMLSSDPFTIALALSYFFLNKEESSMIKAILNGKYYGYDEAYIRGVIG